MAAFLKLIEDEAKAHALKEFFRHVGNDGPVFRSADDTLKGAKYGDLIEIKRDKYFHWTFYIGDGFVLNFECPELDQLIASNVSLDMKGCVEKKLLKEVVANNTCRVNNKLNKINERKLTVLPIETMKANVESELKNPEKNYNLVSFNCEHFVTKLRFGVAFSDQVDLIRKLALEIPELFKELMVHIFKRIKEKN